MHGRGMHGARQRGQTSASQKDPCRSNNGSETGCRGAQQGRRARQVKRGDVVGVVEAAAREGDVQVEAAPGAPADVGDVARARVEAVAPGPGSCTVT